MKPIKFTKSEWTIIEDRLDLSCALGEALEMGLFTRTYISDAAIALSERVTVDGRGSVHIVEATPLEVAILVDCIEGSTLIASLDEAKEQGHVTAKEYTATMRAFRSAEKKLNNL